MVPTVHAMWNTEIKDWPVVGPMHDDEQFFNFFWKHYHVDARFLTRMQQRALGGSPESPKFHERITRACMGSPLQSNHATNSDGLSKTFLIKKKCTLSAPAPPDSRITATREWQAMASHFAGYTCKHGKHGFICPHQHVALGAVAVIDGVITCPLHGLRIDAASGRVLAAG